MQLSRLPAKNAFQNGNPDVMCADFFCWRQLFRTFDRSERYPDSCRPLMGIVERRHLSGLGGIKSKAVIGALDEFAGLTDGSSPPTIGGKAIEIYNGKLTA